MPELWIPGAAGPLEDFVARVVRRIEAFADRRGWEQAIVEVELLDGTQFAVHSISAEPGYGFITLCPYPEDEERPWPRAGAETAVPPEEMIVPVASLKRITLGEVEEDRQVGFALRRQGEAGA